MKKCFGGCFYFKITDSLILLSTKEDSASKDHSIIAWKLNMSIYLISIWWGCSWTTHSMLHCWSLLSSAVGQEHDSVFCSTDFEADVTIWHQMSSNWEMLNISTRVNLVCEQCNYGYCVHVLSVHWANIKFCFCYKLNDSYQTYQTLLTPAVCTVWVNGKHWHTDHCMTSMFACTIQTNCFHVTAMAHHIKSILTIVS